MPAWVSAASIVSRSSATSTLGSGAAAEARCSTFVTHELQPQVNLLLPLGIWVLFLAMCVVTQHSIASLLAGVHVFSAFMSGVTGQSSPLATAAPKRASERDYTEWNVLCLGSVRSTRSPPAPKPPTPCTEDEVSIRTDQNVRKSHSTMRVLYTYPPLLQQQQRICVSGEACVEL